MIILHRGKITYYVKEESVIVNIHDMQFLSYSVYPLQNRKPFYDFKQTILDSALDELTSPAEILRLGERHRLKGFPTIRPTIKQTPNGDTNSEVSISR